eukprot:scaffold327_cov257-Pinguiococcus_pyrenoidosus.AAC.31
MKTFRCGSGVSRLCDAAPFGVARRPGEVCRKCLVVSDQHSHPGERRRISAHLKFARPEQQCTTDRSCHATGFPGGSHRWETLPRLLI